MTVWCSVIAGALYCSNTGPPVIEFIPQPRYEYAVPTTPQYADDTAGRLRFYECEARARKLGADAYVAYLKTLQCPPR